MNLKNFWANQDLVNKVILLFLLIIFVTILATSVSALEDKQLVFCESQNITTFTGCINFWNNITSIMNTTEIINNTILVNNTIFKDKVVNNTIYLEKNCTESFQFKQAEYDYNVRIAEIEKGVPNVTTGLLTPEQSSKQCAKSVEEIKKQYSLPQNNSNNNNDYMKYGFWFVIVGLVLYFGNKYFIKKNNQSYFSNYQPSQQQLPQQFPQEIPQHIQYTPKTKGGVGDAENPKNKGSF